MACGRDGRRDLDGDGYHDVLAAPGEHGGQRLFLLSGKPAALHAWSAALRRSFVTPYEVQDFTVTDTRRRSEVRGQDDLRGQRAFERHVPTPLGRPRQRRDGWVQKHSANPDVNGDCIDDVAVTRTHPRPGFSPEHGRALSQNVGRRRTQRRAILPDVTGHAVGLRGGSLNTGS